MARATFPDSERKVFERAIPPVINTTCKQRSLRPDARSRSSLHNHALLPSALTLENQSLGNIKAASRMAFVATQRSASDLYAPKDQDTRILPIYRAPADGGHSPCRLATLRDKQHQL